MTAHPALLAAPPPLAGSSEETSIRTSISDTPQTTVITAATANIPDLPSAAATGTHEEAAAQNTVAEVAATDSTSAPGQFKDFIGQTMDMAFGPDYKENRPDFEKYGKVLVSQNILPELAFLESPTLNVSLGHDSGHTKSMLNHLSDRYFALKSQA